MSKDTKKNIKGTDNRKNTNSKIPKNLKNTGQTKCNEANQ